MPSGNAAFCSGYDDGKGYIEDAFRYWFVFIGLSDVHSSNFFVQGLSG